MKKVLSIIVASSAFVTFATHAADSTESFDVTASVPESCVMEDINDVNLGEVDIFRSSGADALLLESNSTGNSGNFYISCNLENQVTISSANGALTNQTRSLTGNEDPAAGFVDAIQYRVALDNYYNDGNGPKLITKNGNSVTSASRAAIHRMVKARVTILRDDNKGKRPLAGSYLDTVTVNVQSI